MSLYNILNGVNSKAPILMAILGIDQADKKWSSGRFRDVYLNETGDKILLYTRNGGGNRECWHDSNNWYGNKMCKHEKRIEEVDEHIEATEEEAKLHQDWKPLNIFIGSKRMYKTGNKVKEEQYKCLEPNSEACHCVACNMAYHLVKHPNYITDYDDDFDCTYATIEFSIPERWIDLCKSMVTGEKPETVHEKFLKVFKEMDSMSKEELEKDPRFASTVLSFKSLLSK